MNHDRYIADLVEKFLDGRTTNEEERELYTWFRTHEVPAEWEPLKSMFAWYEAGMPEEVAVEEPAEPKAKVMPLRRWLQVAGGCAAVLAIVLLLFRDGNEEVANHSESGMGTNETLIVADMDYDDDLMRRADILEQQAYELLAWADMNSL
jgi:hypothetical protein